jgi:hypothetical protein
MYNFVYFHNAHEKEGFHFRENALLQNLSASNNLQWYLDILLLYLLRH